MTHDADSTLVEAQIAQWRMYLRRRRAVADRDVEELEAHLRDEIGVLSDSGLAAEEAFLVAVKRMGSLSELSREFAREHSDRLWKQLVIAGEDASGPGAASAFREMIVVFGLAVCAAASFKLLQLLGLALDDEHVLFYIRNIPFFALPFLCGYFAWKRRMAARDVALVAAVLVAAAIVVNSYPFAFENEKPPHTFLLMALHLPLALWLAVGFAYTGGQWFHGDRRMDFVRFSGELFIYYVLIALGGGVITAFTALLFTSIGLNPEWFIAEWLVPCGAIGAVLVASWLVEAKQSVIENMAPVLTRLFTPLLTVVLLGFLAAMAWTGNPIAIEREMLIAFDLLLVLVVGLILYSASARDPQAPPGLFDGLQFLLAVTALAVDVLALAAIAARITEWGFTPNRVAALAENLILLVNLGVTAVLYARLLWRGGSFTAVERWQMAYLPVYSAWAAVVVVAFPPLFGFK